MPANGAREVRTTPVIDAFSMITVSAWSCPDLILFFKIIQTDRTAIHFSYFVKVFFAVRECIRYKETTLFSIFGYRHKDFNVLYLFLSKSLLSLWVISSSVVPEMT